MMVTIFCAVPARRAPELTNLQAVSIVSVAPFITQSVPLTQGQCREW